MAYLVPAGQMTRQPVRVVFTQTTQIHDPRHAGLLGCSPRVLGTNSVGPLEVASVTHGMNQVIDRFDSAQGRIERIWVENISSDDLNFGPPRHTRQTFRCASDAPDLVPSGKQLRNQPTADLSSRPNYCDLHDPALVC